MPLQALDAQSPAPVVVQAVSPAGATPVTAAPQGTGSLQGAILALEQMKAANQETLKRQQAVLEQLDELQKAAEQIKIYTKRG